MSVEPYSAPELIALKRDKGELNQVQINWFIDAYLRSIVAEEQMSAMLMAILLNGMSRKEVVQWTQAYVDSGIRMDWSALGRPTTDKHSTGGVGDKITLPLAPIVAACGACVPQLSGRGLGHTGGTLDKLESIQGWRAQLSQQEMFDIVDRVGAVVCAASDELAPADRRIYALRDVTATVESIPLIAASIMSKKIAEGTSALVLDVKVGSGAFMKNLEDARTLATMMVQIGTDAGVTTRALLTAMDVPLGRTAGNALEVRESLEVLAGGGPKDVVELTVTLAREMLEAAAQKGGKSYKDPADVIRDGSAMDKWREMITAQGGQPDATLPQARFQHDVYAKEAGYLTQLDAYAVGICAWRLGAGRARKEDSVQFGAGVEWHVDLGDSISQGQKLFTLHTDDEQRFNLALAALHEGYAVGVHEATYDRLPLIMDRISL